MLKVLVIDDEKEFCDLLKEYYSEQGYDVCCSHDGRSGIEKTRTFKPDIILLDNRMPIMGGAQVIKIVREFCSAPIICVSAIQNQKTVEECLELGASAYIFKPIVLEDLDQAIHSALIPK